MAPRGILKSPTVFPSEHELRSYEEPRKTRSRSRSRDRRHAEDELQLVVPSTPSSSALRLDRSGTSSQSSRRRRQSRLRSRSRTRRHVRWSDPIEFVVSDGKDVLSLRQLTHRRSSLPGILEDSRARFRESLREEEKNRGDKDASSSRASSGSNHPSPQPPSSSSSHRRPALKATLSSPAVGRASQASSSHSPKPPQTPVHVPTPISHEHRRRRISLPDGLEAVMKSPSHALWLPHHEGDRASQVNGESSHSVHSNRDPSPRPKSSNTPQLHANGHPQHSSYPNDYPHQVPQTPRRYEPALPHAREQPQLRGSGLAPPPPVTFTSQQPPLSARPLSQLTTSTHRSSRSSPPEKRPSPLPLPASPAPSAQRPPEPPTPKSTKSNLFSLPTVDDLFSKDETSNSMMSVRRLFGLSTPKHEPRKTEDEDKDKDKDKDKTHKRRKSKEQNKDAQHESAKHPEDTEPRRRTTSFMVKPPLRESLHRARHSFDMGTFSLIDDMHMRWTAATARHFLPVLTPAEVHASHLPISLNPALTTIYWDVRHPPNAVWSVIPGRKTTVWSGHHEPATVPLLPSLRIVSPYFPWVISARNPAGVTCGDVLSAIHASARQLVWRGEFESLRTTDKNRLVAGYHANRPAKGTARSADSPFDSGSWLVRADWLGQHTVLRGMSVSEMRDHGAGSEVLLSMYLTENRREEKKVVVDRH